MIHPRYSTLKCCWRTKSPSDINNVTCAFFLLRLLNITSPYQDSCAFTLLYVGYSNKSFLARMGSMDELSMRFNPFHHLQILLGAFNGMALPYDTYRSDVECSWFFRFTFQLLGIL